MTFPLFSGEFLTDSKEHGKECSKLANDALRCELVILNGSAKMFGLLSDGYDFAVETWSYNAVFTDLVDDKEIFSTVGSHLNLIVEVPVPLSDFQSVLDSWSSAKSIQTGHNPEEHSCVAEF